MFSLAVNTDNAAFEGDDLIPELVTILSDLIATLALSHGSQDEGSVLDSNGNTVGSWTLT